METTPLHRARRKWTIIGQKLADSPSIAPSKQPASSTMTCVLTTEFNRFIVEINTNCTKQFLDEIFHLPVSSFSTDNRAKYSNESRETVKRKTGRDGDKGCWTHIHRAMRRQASEKRSSLRAKRRSHFNLEGKSYRYNREPPGCVTSLQYAFVKSNQLPRCQVNRDSFHWRRERVAFVLVTFLGCCPLDHTEGKIRTSSLCRAPL